MARKKSNPLDDRLKNDPELRRLNARVQKLQARVDRVARASEMGAYDTSRLSGRVRQAVVDRSYARNEQRLDDAKLRAWNRMNDPLAGRTVEAGTRSALQGMRSWMIDRMGGGGSRLTGR